MNELHFNDRGEGTPVLLIHGTGTDSSVFDKAVGSLAGGCRLITPDRRGWGQSIPDDEYRRTSISEQAIEISSLAKKAETGPLTLVGIGFGAVVGLEIALAEPALVDRLFMIEPNVLGAISEATRGMSADVEAIRAAADEGGEEAAYELFLNGELHTLGCGVQRFSEVADRGPTAARAFLVELPAVPAWPLDPVRLATLESEVTVVTMPSTPDLLKRAAQATADRVPGAETMHLTRDGIDAVTTMLA